MENDNITEDGLASVDAVEEYQETEYESTVNDTVAPETAVEEPTAQEVEALTLEQLNAALGKQFKSKDAALKSIQDTFKYVGKKKEDVADEVSKKDFVSREEFETILFYKDNPEVAKHREVIDAFAKANKITAQEAVGHASLKSLIESASGFEKVQQTKSVMTSSPRLKAVTDISKKALDAVKNGDLSGRDSLVVQMLRESRNQ